MTADPQRVAAIIREAASRHILPRFARLEAFEVMEKGPGDLVTAADIDTEAELTRRLSDLLPFAAVIGEEAAAKDPSIIAELSGLDAAWIVDPVDGTINFAAGKPDFVVMVALLLEGIIASTWIYEPVTDRMTIAARGEGAWRDGIRLSVSRQTPGIANRRLWRRVADCSGLLDGNFDLRCAGLEYLALASGEAYAALYNRLMPWDHAAGYLVHQEAGGFGRQLDGGEYRARTLEPGLLLAPGEEAWHVLRRCMSVP